MKIDPPIHDTVYINEEFKQLDNKPLDSRHRLTLSDQVFKAISGKNKKIDSFQVLVSTRGDVLLRPAVSIPASEAWVYENPAILKTIRKGQKDSKENKITSIKNIDKFIEDL